MTVERLETVHESGADSDPFFEGPAYIFGTEESGINPPGLYGLWLSARWLKAKDQAQILDGHIREGFLHKYFHDVLNPLINNAKWLESNPEFGNFKTDPATGTGEDVSHRVSQWEQFDGIMEQISERLFPTPGWIKTLPGFLIQVMPDRFFNPDLTRSDQARLRWEESRRKPDNRVRSGGTLQGVADKLPYIREFAPAVYTTPVFESPSVHGYDTSDYFRISHRLLGVSEEAYARMDEPEKRSLAIAGVQTLAGLAGQVPLVLDIAANHTSQDFFAFQDVVKNGAKSRYYDWYCDVKTDEDGRYLGVKGWFGFPDLPQLNHGNREVREYFLGNSYDPKKPYEQQSKDWTSKIESLKKLDSDPDKIKEFFEDPKTYTEYTGALGVFGFWSALGIKGWRLDVPNSVNRRGLWKDVRSLVKSIDPEIWLVGEIWNHEKEEEWLTGTEFDAVMNYKFWAWCLDFLVGKNGPRMQHMSGEHAQDLTSSQLAKKITEFTTMHPPQVVRAMMNITSDHDLPRFADLLGDKTRAGYVLLGTLPGVPMIWAGDEMGMKSNKEELKMDPENRAPLMWDQSGADSEETGQETTKTLIKNIAQLREHHSALRSAEVKFIDSEDPDVLTYFRTDASNGDEVFVAVNRTDSNKQVSVTRNGKAISLTLGPHNASILTNEQGAWTVQVAV